MAGTPEDLRVFIDKDVTKDNTYYGKGCSNGWGTDGTGGSITPCADSDAGGRYVTTADGETQKNGTSYAFQAATSGAGGTMTTNNSNSSDTFCPLGWQLPYSGTGGDYYNKSRSWNYLFSRYSIISDQSGATGIKSYPFSYVYSGYFDINLGRLYSQLNHGYYRSITVANNINAYDLHTLWNSIQFSDMANKAIGFNIRCVYHFSIPSSTAR